MSEEALVRACAEGNDSAAWSEFVSRFHRRISLSILRTAYRWSDLPQQTVDDLVQETYLKLCASKCRMLLEFASQHPDAIGGYVKTIATNVARDHFKSLYSKKRGSGEVSQIAEHGDPQAPLTAIGGQQAMEREILLKQINKCLEWCSQGPDHERDCTIFWLYYLQGMSAKDIATLPTICLSAKGVESVIFRLTRMVREQLVGFQLQKGSSLMPGEKGFLQAESY